MHTVFPLSYNDINKRETKQREVLLRIKASLEHLASNGPNTVLGVLPNGNLICVCDPKKLRPVVVGRDDDTVIMTSEVAGINDLMPHRDISKDIYPKELEMIVVSDSLKIERLAQ
jgi:glutamine phosphoribosylpyrophosphate amidotransferase